MEGDKPTPLNLPIPQNNFNQYEDYDNNIEDLVETQQKIKEKKKIKSGLRSNDGGAVPLKSVFVKSRLLDMIGEIIVFQHYKNEGNSPIEAKYVFPLDEMSSVCGFEAFINGKHIIGTVKEKEQARKEYKEAISKGLFHYNRFLKNF